eukprot:gene27553-33279_t
MNLALKGVLFALAVTICLGKLASKDKLTEAKRMKQEAVQQMRKSMGGVDVTQLRMVRRSGQNLQASTNGWAYLNMYAFDDCSAPQGFYTLGIATDVCLMSRPEVDVPASSYYYSCNDDVWTMQQFANANCDASGLANTTYLNVSSPGVCGVYPPPMIGGSDDDGNSTTVDDDGMSSIYNAVYSCSASNSLNLTSNYVLSQYYDSDTCSQMGSFDGYLDGGCFPLTFGDVFDDDFDDDYLGNVTYFSMLTDYSKQYYFFGSDCTGTSLGSAKLPKLVNQCSNAAYFYFDDDYDDDTDDTDDVDDDGILWTGYTSALTCTVPDNTDCDPSSSNDDDGLSDGAVAGAVIGSVAGAALIGGGALLVAKGGFLGASSGEAASMAAGAAENAAL